MSRTTTALVTGANKGIGYESARQLIAAGRTVWLGCRDQPRGERAAAAIGGRFVQLDVTDDASVEAAAQTVGNLDVLVNNAGIMDFPWTPAGDVTPDLIRRLYETNVFGLVRVMRAFLPLLAESASPVVVNVGSSLGSLGRVTTPGLPESAVPALAYGSSNTGLQTAAEAAAIIVRMACLGPDGPTGSYRDADGQLPW